MIRVVLDTNVVVSAMLRSGGLPEAVFNLALGGEAQCYVSLPILVEYEDVLRRPRLAIQPDKINVALDAVRKAAMLVRPEARGLQRRPTPMTISSLSAPRRHRPII